MREGFDTATGHLTDGVGEQLTAALAGDRRQWQLLVQRYTPMLQTVVARYRLGDEADDVLQATFLAMVEHASRIRDPQALPKWLIMTARYEALRLLRRRGRVVLPAADDWESRAVCTDEAPDDRLVRLEREAALHELLAGLPVKQRTLLGLLSQSDRPDYRRVGEIMGMPVSSIGPTRRRGLDRLRLDWDARHASAA